MSLPRLRNETTEDAVEQRTSFLLFPPSSPLFQTPLELTRIFSLVQFLIMKARDEKIFGFCLALMKEDINLYS